MWELSSEKGMQSRAAGMLFGLGSVGHRGWEQHPESHSQDPAAPTTLKSERAFPDRPHRSLVNAHGICSYTIGEVLLCPPRLCTPHSSVRINLAKCLLCQYPGSAENPAANASAKLFKPYLAA